MIKLKTSLKFAAVFSTMLVCGTAFAVDFCNMEYEVCVDNALWEVDVDCRGDEADVGNVCIDLLLESHDDDTSKYAAAAWYDFDGDCEGLGDSAIGFTPESFFTTLKHELKWTDVLKNNGKSSSDVTVEVEFENLEEACDLE